MIKKYNAKITNNVNYTHHIKFYWMNQTVHYQGEGWGGAQAPLGVSYPPPP